jgi:hypothetical protein
MTAATLLHQPDATSPVIGKAAYISNNRDVILAYAEIFPPFCFIVCGSLSLL